MRALEIIDLCKVYRGKKFQRVEALKDVSFSVERGEVFGFLGPNGAGKSTTIKVLMGLVRASQGQAKILGMDCSSFEARRKVGYLPENPAFYDYLNALEFLSFIGRTFSMSIPDICKRSEAVLRRLDLWDARKRQIRSYSKGMVQRLGMAQVLLHEPEIYILDEPMSGLDPVGRALVKELILELKESGKSVFFSSHITSDVESVCDRVAILKGGVLKSENSVKDLLAASGQEYRIQFLDSNGQHTERIVGKHELTSFLVDAEKSGTDIGSIELCRVSLEQFFLDTIKA
jgi:ABC-2 type transport system ATP-binding protein